MTHRLRQGLFALGFLAGIVCGSGARASTVDDSCLEAWELSNFQSKSPTFGQLVKSSSYRDRVTVVMLLSGG